MVVVPKCSYLPCYSKVQPHRIQNIGFSIKNKVTVLLNSHSLRRKYKRQKDNLWPKIDASRFARQGNVTVKLTDRSMLMCLVFTYLSRWPEWSIFEKYPTLKRKWVTINFVLRLYLHVNFVVNYTNRNSNCARTI